MLTKEQNERLTQIGPGTPGGELLRRYWLPFATLQDVSEENPTTFVRLLGEDLVLFRDKSGQVGLIGDHCPHRGASLLYGRVEERGIACAYHGWLYDTQGNCLETPAEPADSKLYLTVKHRAYPVEPLFGLYWTYMGSPPAPPLRKLDIMEYPINRVRIENEFSANWIQVMENNLDGSHIFVLHQDTYSVGRDANGERPKATSTTRGLISDLRSLDYEEVPAGILRKMGLGDGYVEEDLLIFPNMLRRMNMLSLKVPVDDFHTKKFVVTVDMGLAGQLGSENNPLTMPSPAGAEGGMGSNADIYFRVPTNAKTPIDAPYPEASYSMKQLPHQDMMAIESQGPRSAREAWRLGTRDAGIAFFNEMILREIDKVERGLAPIAVDEAFIDTKLEAVHTVGLR